jgi:hypothetical protein
VRTAAKWLGILLGAILLLGLLGWTGTFFYWHWRIRGDIRILENGPTTQERDGAYYRLIEGGCRSLPYVIDSLNPANEDSELPDIAFMVFHWHCGTTGTSEDPDQDFWHHGLLLQELQKSWRDSPERRRQGTERLRARWKEVAPRYHRWWRVWSPTCRRARI